MSDNSDVSYITPDTGIDPNFGEIGFDLETFAFGAATINSVTPRVRISGTNSIDYVETFLTDSSFIQYHYDSFATPGAITTLSGATYTTKPTGGAWTQAYIDAMMFYLYLGDNNGIDPRPRVYEVYVDIDYTPPPGSARSHQMMM